MQVLCLKFQRVLLQHFCLHLQIGDLTPGIISILVQGLLFLFQFTVALLQRGQFALKTGQAPIIRGGVCFFAVGRFGAALLLAGRRWQSFVPQDVGEGGI